MLVSDPFISFVKTKSSLHSPAGTSGIGRLLVYLVAKYLCPWKYLMSCSLVIDKVQCFAYANWARIKQRPIRRKTCMATEQVEDRMVRCYNTMAKITFDIEHKLSVFSSKLFKCNDLYLKFVYSSHQTIMSLAHGKVEFKLFETKNIRLSEHLKPLLHS